MNMTHLILLIAAVVALLWYIMVHVRTEQLKRFESKVGNIFDIKKIIDKLRYDTCIEQVLIWECANGGGVARFGDKLKMSVVDESSETPFRSVMEDFQGMVTDGEAIEILMEMQQNEWTARRTFDMNDGVMKRMFLGENAQWVEWFAIGPGSDRTFFYASIATSKPDSPYQLNQGGKIDIAKNALRAKYRKMNNTPIRRLRKILYV